MNPKVDQFGNVSIGDKTLGHYSSIEFPDRMKIIGINKLGKVARLLLDSEVDTVSYEMLTSEMTYMLKNAFISQGYVQGVWGFAKHGQITGLRFIRNSQ